MGDHRAEPPIEQAIEDAYRPVMAPEQPPIDDAAGGPDVDDEE